MQGLRIDEGVCTSLPLTVANRDYLIVPPRHKAGLFPVVDVRRVFDTTERDKAKSVKKSIAEENPVLFLLPEPAASEIDGGLWKPLPESASRKPAKRGENDCRGTMIAVGYDDAKHGGAFEVMRGCGTDNRSEGFFWLRYEDFDRYCSCAVEVIGNRGSTTKPAELSGALRFEDASGAVLPAQRQGRVHRLQGAFPSATRFRVIVTSNKPAYIYVFASDLTGKISPLFPMDGGSAYLASQESHVTIPDEKEYLHLDDRPGTDYVCALYSTRRLDFSTLIHQVEGKQGELLSRLEAVLGKDLVPDTAVQYTTAGVPGFTTQSTDGSVLPVIIEIHHVR